jgi:hypothetical protein
MVPQCSNAVPLFPHAYYLSVENSSLKNFFGETGSIW